MRFYSFSISQQSVCFQVFYGLLKEPDIDVTLDDEDEAGANDSEQGEAASKPKKKKKREILSRKNKADPNAPSNSRIPLPEMKVL